MEKYDVIIIGGGPAGYAGAVTACECNMKVALIEKESLGGICVNWGCIPTKALLRFAKLHHEGQPITYTQAIEKSLAISEQRRNSIVALISKLGGKLFTDVATKIEQGKVTLQSGEVVEGKNILIATGSRARRLPIADYDDTHVVTTREAFLFRELPESAAVIGSGATGIEFASIWSRFGAKVSDFEMLPNVMGFDDLALSEVAKDGFAREGLNVSTNVKVTKVSHDDEFATVTYEDAEGTHELKVKTVLIAAGVIPNSENLGLEELGIELVRGNIQVNKNMETNIKGIYAAGDVTGKLALAFASTMQAKNAIIAMIGGDPKEIDYNAVPRCVFSSVEAAFVGPNDKRATDLGYEITTKIVPVFSFSGTGVNKNQGLAKIVADAKTGKTLSVSIVGPDAADFIAAPARLIANGMSLDEVANALAGGR